MLNGWQGGRRLARKQAAYVLDNASSAEEVSSALLTYVAALAGIASPSLTRREAVTLLQNELSEQTVEEFDQLLATCEVACYAGASGADIQALVATARKQLQNIRRFHLRSPGKNRWLRTAVLLGACCFFTGLWGNSVGQLVAAELSHDQTAQILKEGSSAYQRGLVATTDAAVAKEAFSEAASKYQLLVDQGIKNGKLYSNLATAYLQSGQVALALANYERALAYLPGDSPIQAGRDRALFLLTGEKQIQKQSFSEWFQYWNERISQHLRLWSGIFFWSVFWLALAAVLWLRISVCRKVVGVAALGCLLSGFSLGFQYWQTDSADRGVVVAEDVELRAGNGSAFASLGGTTLPEGSRFEVVQRRGDWIQVRTTDGREGWVAAAAAEIIESHVPRAT